MQPAKSCAAPVGDLDPSPGFVGVEEDEEIGRAVAPIFAVEALQLSRRGGNGLARLEGHSIQVSTMCLLPDRRLASGFDDRTIRLWDLATGAQIACLEGHCGRVRALCLLPDGRLASRSDNNTIRLWDVGKWSEIARLEPDAPIRILIAIAHNILVAGDSASHLHWLKILD
jgi:WD40 repeat protein